MTATATQQLPSRKPSDAIGLFVTLSTKMLNSVMKANGICGRLGRFGEVGEMLSSVMKANGIYGQATWQLALL